MEVLKEGSAIAGDYIVPEVTHLGKEIHINMILDNLGPPNNNKNKYTTLRFTIIT